MMSQFPYHTHIKVCLWTNHVYTSSFKTYMLNELLKIEPDCIVTDMCLLIKRGYSSKKQNHMSTSNFLKLQCIMVIHILIITRYVYLTYYCGWAY